MRKKSMKRYTYLVILVIIIVIIIAIGLAGINMSRPNNETINPDNFRSYTTTYNMDTKQLLIDMGIDVNQGEKVLGELVAALDNGDPDIEMAAALAISELGSKGKAAVPSLLIKLKSYAPIVSMGSAIALEKIGLEPKEAEKIVKMGTKGSCLKSVAVRALNGVSPDAIGVLPFLIDALSDSDPTIKLDACMAISKFGPKAKMALQELQELAENDPYLHPAGIYIVRNAAKEAIDIINK
jgi:HEAT repeat protein